MLSDWRHSQQSQSKSSTFVHFDACPRRPLHIYHSWRPRRCGFFKSIMPLPDADTEVRASSEGEFPSTDCSSQPSLIQFCSRRDACQPLLPSHKQPLFPRGFLHQLVATILHRRRYLHQRPGRRHACPVLYAARWSRVCGALRDRVSGCARHQPVLCIWRARNRS